MCLRTLALRGVALCCAYHAVKDARTVFSTCQARGIDPVLAACVSDLARSAPRMATRTGGKWTTLTTSVRLFDYTRKKLLSGQELMAMAGYDLTQFCSKPTQYPFLNRCSGNAMTPSALGAAILSMILCVIPVSGGKAPLQFSVPSQISVMLADEGMLTDEDDDLSSRRSSSVKSKGTANSSSASSSSSVSSMSNSDSTSVPWLKKRSMKYVLIGLSCSLI